MLQDILAAIWFFLPAGVSNMAPVFAAKVPVLKHWSVPLDCGISFRGTRLLGDHKTWRGLLSGVLLGVFVAWLQQVTAHHFKLAGAVSSVTPTLLVGGLLGLGALIGDALKSFFKRQLRKLPGDSWFPFDQLDYILGGVLATLPFIRLSLAQYMWLLVVWFGLHIAVSYIGFLLRFKDKPI